MQLILMLVVGLGLLPVFQSAEDMRERLDEAAGVVDALLNAPDSDVPGGLLDDAECVAVIPNVKKVAFGFGGQYGRGAASCRANGTGAWSAPSMIALDAGSFGFQIGGSSMDVVLVFVGENSSRHLLGGEVTLGGDANVAAGPKGRNVGADTNLKFDAEILSYSRSKGLFAGVSLEGASLRPDRDANEALYGFEISAEAILVGGTAMPAGGDRFIASLGAN